jgi:hypothetical protein
VLCWINLDPRKVFVKPLICAILRMQPCKVAGWIGGMCATCHRHPASETSSAQVPECIMMIVCLASMLSHAQGMGPAFTAAIVRQLGVTGTAALVGRFEGPLTGDLVQHFGPGKSTLSGSCLPLSNQPVLHMPEASQPCDLLCIWSQLLQHGWTYA